MPYAIVTGGARGFGLGIVKALFEHNVVDEVAVIDLSLAPAPDAIANKVHGFTADVTDEKQVHQAVEAIVAKLGPNPPCYATTPVADERAWFEHGREGEWETVEIFRRYVDLNLNSVHIVTREVAPRMKAGAAICNTASIAGQLASPFLAAYAAAKAGVISYSKTCALQLGPKGIRVNAVAPGLIYTQGVGRPRRGARRWRCEGTCDLRGNSEKHRAARARADHAGHRAHGRVAMLRTGAKCYWPDNRHRWRHYPGRRFDRRE